MLEIEKKYLTLSGVQIKREYRGSLNFRCPICGDSKSNKYKARGSLSAVDDGSLYHCFNCDFSGNFKQFLDAFAPQFTSSYLAEIGKLKREKYISKQSELDVFKPAEIEIPKVQQLLTHVCVNESVYSVENLSTEAIEYLKTRCIDSADMQQFRWVPALNSIMIELRNPDGIFGYQLRAIKDKWFHNHVEEGFDKCWNLDHVLSLPKGSKIYVFESIFNALSIVSTNVMASLGASMSSDLLEILKDYELVICYDNDQAGIDKTIKMTERGYQALVHHDNFIWNDVNDARKDGITKEQIQGYIDSNVMTARMANMKLRLR